MQTKINGAGENAYESQLILQHRTEFQLYINSLGYLNPTQKRVLLKYYQRKIKRELILSVHTHAMAIFFNALINNELDKLSKFTCVKS